MRLRLAIFLIITLSLIVGSYPSDGQSQTRLLVIGDSLSRGLYASAENKTYRALLGDWLDFEVGNLRGCTLAGAEQKWPDWQSWGAALIIVELGINDVGNNPSCPQISETEWPARYAMFIDMLEATGARVIVATIPWCGWEPGQKYDKVIRYNGYIKDAATPSSVADLWSATLNCEDCISQPGEPSVFPPGFQGDGFHPGDLGHYTIATTFMSPIRPPRSFLPMVSK